MDIGTGLFTCQRRPDDDRSMADIYEELCELASAVDDAGLASAWVSEHHFEPDGYLPATMPALAAMARETSDVELGPCVALGPLYDPVRLAEDAAVVDLLSGGRLNLGLALGSNPAEFAEFGVDPDERVARLEDAIHLLRGAWSEGPIDHDSAFHDVSPETTVTPSPDGEVPILLGGAAKPAVRRAARLADGWIAPSKLTVEGVAKRVEDIRSVRAEEGLDGEFSTYVIRHGFVGDSREEAWAAMRDGYFYIQRRYAEIFSGERVEELTADRRAELKRQAVFGTPGEVTERLGRYREAVDDDVHVILRTYHPGTDTDRMCECIHRLGEEVAPRL